MSTSIAIDVGDNLVPFYDRINSISSFMKRKFNKFKNKRAVRKIIHIYKVIASYHLLIDIVMFCGYALITAMHLA